MGLSWRASPWRHHTHHVKAAKQAECMSFMTHLCLLVQVDYAEEAGTLYHFRYPVGDAESPDACLSVDTAPDLPSLLTPVSMQEQGLVP